MKLNLRSYTSAHMWRKRAMAGRKLKGIGRVWSDTMCDQREQTHAGINAWIHPACRAACLT